MSNHSSPRKPSSGKGKNGGSQHPHHVTVFTLKLADVTPDQLEIIDLDSGIPLAHDDQDTAANPETAAVDSRDDAGVESESSAGASSADDEDPQSPAKGPATAITAPVTHSCHICGRMFPDLLAQRAHFRSSWHTANLQRKMRGESPLTEQEYATFLGQNTATVASKNPSKSPASNDHDSDSSQDDTDGENGDFSLYDPVALTPVSLDMDSADAHMDPTQAAPRTHAGRTLLAFRLTTHPETLYTVHRAVFPALPPWRPSTNQLHASLVSMSSPPSAQPPLRIAYLMLGGGHFAGAIFDNDKCLVHASVHRYTTRRKQGGSQSAQDNQRHAKSAGASLRRYNEAALARDVWDQMAAWHAELEKAHIVFVVAPGVTNKRTLLQHPEGFGVAKEDKRIRGVPFTTRRPGYKEIIRVHRKLISVGVQAYVEPAPEPEPAKVDVEAPQPVVLQQPIEQEQAHQQSGPEIVLARKKKRKPRASRKTGTLPQAATDSSSGTEESGHDDPDSPNVSSKPTSPPSTGPQRLGGGPAPSTAMSGLPSMVQGLGLAGMSAETRVALERERRARAAERRLGIASPPVHAATPPPRVLTGATTPSMRSAAHAVATQLASTNSLPQLDPAAASGPPCDECGQPVIKKALKKHGKQFCGIRCAAAASKKDGAK